MAQPIFRLLAACLVSSLFLLADLAVGGTISVMPTRVDFNAERGVQSLLLTNLSGETVTVEAQMLVWPEDAEGQQANDVVVTPAVVTLPPNQRMRVRIGLLRRDPTEVERSYRVYFTELPVASTQQNLGIAVRLRVGVPVFVAPRERTPAPIVWSGQLVEGAWRLRAANPGNVHVRLGEAFVAAAGTQSPLALGSRYVLPGRSLDLPLPGRPAPGARIRWTDGGGDEHESPVALP